jgi:hypothetical protein
MADFDRRAGADPHANGTIWASALWDLRTRLAGIEARGATQTDRLVLAALLVLRRGPRGGASADPKSVRRAKRSFLAGLRALLEADEITNDGRYRCVINAAFKARGIVLDHDAPSSGESRCQPASI